MFHVSHAALSVPRSLVVTSWERADLLAFLCVVFSCVFVIFPCGVLGQVWYLIVSIPELCLLLYFRYKLCLESVKLRGRGNLNWLSSWVIKVKVDDTWAKPKNVITVPDDHPTQINTMNMIIFILLHLLILSHALETVNIK